MHKFFKLLLIVAFIVMTLTACSNNSIQTTPIPAATKTLIPTITPKPTVTPQPVEPSQPQPDTSTPEYIVGEWLADPQAVWSEGVEAMTENQGGQFGPGSNKFYNADENVFSITGSESSIWTPLNTRLDEWQGVEKNGNQAILVKWQAYPLSGLSFTFMGNAKEFSVQFQDSCHLARIEGIEDFNDNIIMEEGTWYYTLMAMDKDGNFRSVVWEVEDPAILSTYVGDFGEEYANDSWKFILGSTAPMTLNIAEYTVYGYNSFVQ